MDLTAENPDGATALYLAVKTGNLSLVKSIVEAFQSRHLSTTDMESPNEDDWTPLHRAAKLGKVEIVKYLLSVGFNKEAKNDWPATPLYIACFYNQPEVVKVLLEAGANYRLRQVDGYSPREIAQKKGFNTIVNLLHSAASASRN